VSMIALIVVPLALYYRSAAQSAELAKH
jgi:hypothetical protein